VQDPGFTAVSAFRFRVGSLAARQWRIAAAAREYWSSMREKPATCLQSMTARLGFSCPQVFQATVCGRPEPALPPVMLNRLNVALKLRILRCFLRS